MAVLLAVFAGGALAETAPQGSLDANNLDATPSTAGQLSLSRYYAIGQTFTAVNSGELTSAQALLFLYAIGTPPTEPFTMEITNVDASGAPVGEPLASTTIPASAVSAVGPIPGSLVTGVFSDPATVEAGQQYALVLKTRSFANYAVAISTTEVGSPYEGGIMPYQFDPFGEFGGPSEWFRGESIDMIFAIYVTPDTKAPEVASVNPDKEAQGAARGSTVSATFSEAVRATTLTSSTVQLFSGNSTKPIKATLSVNPATDPTSVTLTPSERLDAKTRYTAKIKGGATGVKDLAGNPLSSDFSWTFTTGVR